MIFDSYILQWDKLFEEIARVMKPGGAFEVRDLVTQDDSMAK